MLNDSRSKSIAILCLTAIAIANVITHGVDTITVAVIGFIGGILVSKT